MDEADYEVKYVGNDPTAERPTVRVDVRKRQAILEEATGLTTVIRRRQRPFLSWARRVRNWFNS